MILASADATFFLLRLFLFGLGQMPIAILVLIRYYWITIGVTRHINFKTMKFSTFVIISAVWTGGVSLFVRGKIFIIIYIRIKTCIKI